MVTGHSFPEGSLKNHPLAQLAPAAPESTTLNTRGHQQSNFPSGPLLTRLDTFTAFTEMVAISNGQDFDTIYGYNNAKGVKTCKTSASALLMHKISWEIR